MNRKTRRFGAAAAYAVAIVAIAAGLPAYAADAPAAADDAKGLKVSGDFAVDIVSAVQGGATHKVRELDVLTVTVDADFEKLAGWKGGSGSISFQNTSGQRPNEDVGAVQGVDNNEVVGRRGRIFEAWLQQDFGSGSFKAGLVDLNAEFYATDSSGLLLAPESGIGSELGATGPGGPSIFPITGLSARLELHPGMDTYIRAAVFNPHVGDPGDPGGVDTRFDDGLIQIAEAGWTGAGKLALGAWRYSKHQDDLFDTDVLGNPVRRTAQGYYILFEHVLHDGGEMGAKATGFIRAGTSDGDTGIFKSSWDTGVLVEHVIASRPDSQFSFGVDQAQLGSKFRLASLVGGLPLARNETHFEATYSDKLTEHLTVQPDLQYIVNPGGDPAAKNALMAIMRITAAF